MKILVSGSLRGVDDGRKVDVRTAAEELGKAIAAAGHTLLVGSISQVAAAIGSRDAQALRRIHLRGSQITSFRTLISIWPVT